MVPMTMADRCDACGKKDLQPGDAIEVSLHGKPLGGEETCLRSITTCKECHAKIAGENGDILAVAMRSMVSSGKESYLATYAKHLERRLRDMETDAQLKDVDVAKMETELENAKEHVDFLEKIVAACKGCKSLFDQLKSTLPGITARAGDRRAGSGGSKRIDGL